MSELEGWIPALQAEIAEMEADIARLAEALRKMEERAEQAEQNQWHEHEALERADKLEQERYNACLRAVTAEGFARLAEERAGRLEAGLRQAREAWADQLEADIDACCPHMKGPDGFYDGPPDESQMDELSKPMIEETRALIAAIDAALDQTPVPTCK